jgi:cytochrome c peroxidase
VLAALLGEVSGPTQKVTVCGGSLAMSRFELWAFVLGIAAVAGCSKPSADSQTKTEASAEAASAVEPDALTPAAITPTAASSSEGASETADSTDTTEPSNTSAEQQSTEETTEAAGPAPTEEVLLGAEELIAGIPGEGKLTVEQINKWLDDTKNHVVLKPTLPLGLDAGAGKMAGLDQNPLTRATIELGRQLFFDPRLSKDGTISCASCHHPDFGYAKNTQFGEGVNGQKGNRNSPVAYNRVLSSGQFWDGRAATLEEQAKGPIANPIEMANTHDVCVDYLNKIPGYKLQFDRLFPGEGVNIENVAKAIASFERALVTGPSPWDYHEALKTFTDQWSAEYENFEDMKEDDPELYAEYVTLKEQVDKNPMSESAIRGAELFFGQKASCTACHVGANFTDELYHNLGVGMDAAQPDLGRYVVTGEEKDKGAFKTPTVRNVEHTAPYMHDGSQKTLEEVVEWYDKGGHPNPWLDEKIKPLKLTDQEKADLVAYMKALTGPLPKVQTERLPE